jgi:hypothetical protein
MNRLVTWVLVVLVVVLAVQSRKQAAVLKELQSQRRWVVQARDEHEGWREMMEKHDEERETIRARQWQIADVLGIDFEEGETRRAETRRDVGLHNEY